MAKRIINLTGGFFYLVPISDSLGFVCSSFYRNVYLQERLILMKNLEKKCIKNNWEGVSNFQIYEFQMQIIRISRELDILKCIPDNLPHNPAKLLLPIPKNILAFMSKKQRCYLKFNDDGQKITTSKH